jgi:hypothetical protein
MSRSLKKKNKRSYIPRSFPQEYKAKPVMSRKLRFFAFAAIAEEEITARCLLNLVLAEVSGNTTAINLYESIRITRVNIWYAPDSNSGLAPSTGSVQLTWKGDRGRDDRHEAVGTLSHLAHISTSPPEDSLAAFWVNNFNNLDVNMFVLTLPATSILDLSFDFCIGDGTTRSCTLTASTFTGVSYADLNNAITAGTVGQLTLRPLGLTRAIMSVP